MRKRYNRDVICDEKENYKDFFFCSINNLEPLRLVEVYQHMVLKYKHEILVCVHVFGYTYIYYIAICMTSRRLRPGTLHVEQQ